ncbi:hypothetical protein LCGC14_2214570 [marine sediment metagenome]|uniref:Uncharacterized protein n=1 Tax=marine sediment metagenome TaxID=412755 RepID=A0A0F9E093_9ZZZZ
MKKIIMHTQVDDRPKDKPLVEDYLIEDDQDPTEYAQNLLDDFNATLRPNESSRTLLKVVEESLEPILTAEEFLDEIQQFRRWLRDERKSAVYMDEVEEIYENMIRTGYVEEFQNLIEESGCENSTERFQRLIDSPIENLQYDVTLEDLKKEMEEEEESAPGPFENIHPMGIVKGGLSIGVYADPMSFSSSQTKDFENLEESIKEGMGDRKYYTTRLQDPGEAVNGHFDLVVVDYGGMTIPGMSGMGGFLARAVRTILEEQPSTMVWLASIFTVNGYMDLVEGEYGEEHPNLIIAEIEKEKSWKPLHELWSGDGK